MPKNEYMNPLFGIVAVCNNSFFGEHKKLIGKVHKKSVFGLKMLLEKACLFFPCPPYF